MRTSLPIFLLLSGVFFGGCTSFVCPRICRCSSTAIRGNNVTEGSALAVDNRDKRLFLYHLSLQIISSHSFEDLRGVLRIEITQSVTLKTIETLAFNNLPSLSEISIQNTRNLLHINRGTFNNLPKFHYLSISNTGITVFPDITSINSLESEFILHICDNLYLLEIPPNSLNGMTKEYITMNLFNNGIREIHKHAFNGTKIDKLVLENNRKLSVIHGDAFKGATGPGVFSHEAAIAGTGVTSGVVCLVSVRLEESASPAGTEEPTRGSSHLQQPLLCIVELERSQDFPVNPTGNDSSTSCDESDPSARIQPEIGGLEDTTLLMGLPFLSGVDLSVEDDGFRDVNFHYPELDFCSTRSTLVCTPEADAFIPCEDIAGFSFLRVAIWFITILAVTGNLMVLLVFLTSCNKQTVPRFLMCHLAFADLCIGVYLLMIATVDLRTCGRYSQYAIEWQTGPGCSAAGFLSVFGGEMSVYTLSTITLEHFVLESKNNALK